MRVNVDIQNETDTRFAINIALIGTEAELVKLAENAAISEYIYRVFTGEPRADLADIINDNNHKKHDG